MDLSFEYDTFPNRIAAATFTGLNSTVAFQSIRLWHVGSITIHAFLHIFHYNNYFLGNFQYKTFPCPGKEIQISPDRKLRNSTHFSWWPSALTLVLIHAPAFYDIDKGRFNTWQPVRVNAGWYLQHCRGYLVLIAAKEMVQKFHVPVNYFLRKESLPCLARIFTKSKN